MTDPQAPVPTPDAPLEPPSAPPPAPPSTGSTGAGQPGHWQPGDSRAYPRRGGDRSWVVGVVLVALGILLLLSREIPDVGRFVVLVVGLGLLLLFLATREYGALVPAGIVTGVGAGIVLASEYQDQLGGGLFLISLGSGFVAIWVLSGLFRLREHHWWPLIPGLIMGSIGAATVLEEPGQPAAEAIATGWPIVLVLIGLWLVAQTVLNRRA